MYEYTREEFGEDAEDDVTTFITTLDLEDFEFIKEELFLIHRVSWKRHV